MNISQNRETERALLGALLQVSDLYAEVSTTVTVEAFTSVSHQIVWSALGRLVADGSQADTVTVIDELERAGTMEAAGGISYVLGHLGYCPSPHGAAGYATRIVEHYTRRRLHLAALTITEQIETGDLDTVELLDSAETLILQVAQSSTTGRDWVAVGASVADDERVIMERARNPGALTGVTTGFVDLDRKLTGWQKTDLVVLAARPAMGKTALALNMASAAAASGVAVGVFSMEMSADQLRQRLYCAAGRVDAGRVRTGQLKQDDVPRLQQAFEDVARLPLYIDDTCGLTIATLRSKARRLKLAAPTLGLIVVDYLQLMQGTGGAKESRENIISAISRGLKVLAKDLQVPILALSQLNRGVEGRTEKRPMMSDLRESGAIEQDADVILFIYRDEVYNDDSEDKGIAEVNVSKQRAGETGVVKLGFQGQFVRFNDLEQRGDRWTQSE
jgi:replicative DNA helicase